MPFQLLYSALLTQTSNSISPSIASDSRNTITGTWQRVDTGSFYFLSSGSFTGLSGSYTGSIGAYLTYAPSSSNDTGSIIFFISSSSTASLKTTFNPSTFTLSDSVIKGTCSINIGINYI
jgi:hypothetical protein